MKKLKAAVIGLGLISGGHVQAYQDNENVELYAVCDHDKSWLAYMKDKLGNVKAYDDYHELLADPEIDIVSICLPTYLHMQASIDALLAGKHVLCEKPMALSAEEGRRMREAELKSGKKLMISHNQRFGEDIQAMRKFNKEGKYGDIYHVRLAWRRPMGLQPSPTTTRENGEVYDRNWFNEKERGGGVLRDLGSHLLDLTMHILDFPELDGAYASGYRKFHPPVSKEDEGKYKFDSEDMISGLIKMKNGVSIQLEVSFASPIDREVLLTDIYGTKMGTRRIDGVRVIKVDNDTDSFTVESVDVTKMGFEPFRHPAHSFIDSVINGKPVAVPSDEGIKVLEILDALYASAGF